MRTTPGGSQKEICLRHMLPLCNRWECEKWVSVSLMECYVSKLRRTSRNSVPYGRLRVRAKRFLIKYRGIIKDKW